MAVDGLRGRDVKLIKVLTATVPSKVYTDLKGLRDGVKIGRTRDTWDNDDMDELVYKKEGVGNMSLSLTGSYKFIEDDVAQEALRTAFETVGHIEMQYAYIEGTGNDLFTATMNISALDLNLGDPVTEDFTMSLRSSVTKTTQA